MKNAQTFIDQQTARNHALIDGSKYMRPEVESSVLPFTIDLKAESMSDDQLHVITALGKDAATTALKTLASLAKINELDHLGGGLELIPSLLMTLAACNGESRQYTIEHAHTSIGYYAALAALGYLDKDCVAEEFRRSLDIAGHVSWVPGGSQLNGGRLGVMVPVAVGQALGLKAHHGEEARVFCHCGDAGWVSGQALNGFLGASLHGAPTIFIMHRNGIQLSNTCNNVMDRDPRPMIASMGIEIIEVPSLHCTPLLFKAYAEADRLASEGKPSMIFPVGTEKTLTEFGETLNIKDEVEAFATRHEVRTDMKVWIPGSLMSWRDVDPMLECIFHVNNLPGGQGHHDGHMKGRDLDAVLANPMFAQSDEEKAAIDALRAQPPAKVVTKARPAVGSPNLILSKAQLDEVSLPEGGKSVSPRAGSQLGYAAVAKAFPSAFFTVSCDLDPSTKMDKAKTFIDEDHKFEMSITEQVSALMTDGLACSSHQPQVNVFATFAAFFEGLAREAMEMWRYQRNLTGKNEGLNATMHLSHVGAMTGRDHFSGWALDWITCAMGYLPYLHRFYTPCDARAAFIAVKDLSANYGGSIIGIPRDNVPVLTKQGSDEALWDAHSEWEPVTEFRINGAKKAILAMGCTAFLAEQAAEKLGGAVDVLVINGLPFNDGQMADIAARYPEGIVTVEDGIIATPDIGLRGFASLVQSGCVASGVPTAHVGITDPTIAPSHGFDEVWEHFGITVEGLTEAVASL